MARMLHQTFADDQLHQARGSLLAALAEAGKESGDDPPPFRLRAVNSLWLQRDYPIVRGYLDTLAGDYDAGLALLDFITDPDGARQVINDAVAEQTEGRIEDLIPEGVITALTRLVLTNAVYFKANWVSEFDPDQTAPGSFHLADGSTITVPMMSTTTRWPSPPVTGSPPAGCLTSATPRWW
jgi:serpin B